MNHSLMTIHLLQFEINMNSKPNAVTPLSARTLRKRSLKKPTRRQVVQRRNSGTLRQEWAKALETTRGHRKSLGKFCLLFDRFCEYVKAEQGSRALIIGKLIQNDFPAETGGPAAQLDNILFRTRTILEIRGN